LEESGKLLLVRVMCKNSGILDIVKLSSG